MKNKYNKYLIVFVMGVFGDQVLAANVCPPPPSSVSPSLSSKVSFDKKTKIYKYSYSIKNSSSGQIPLDYFGLLINQSPSSSRSGKNWEGEFISATDSGPAHFNCTTNDVADPDKVTGDGTLSEPLYAIKPGRSLDGFEISSSEPPSIVQYYAEGFTQPPSSIPTVENSEPKPNCPGWDFESAKIQTQVTGMTVGPSDSNTTSVIIRAREQKGLQSCSPINPKSPSGKISILVFSTPTFDASQINVSSVVFGPGYATPVSSKLVQTGIGEKIGADERSDWERNAEESNSEEFNRKKVQYKNILLTFDVASLDVQCNLDQALFLRGKTNAGKNIVGAISANVAGCSSKEIGKRKHRHIPIKWWKR